MKNLSHVWFCILFFLFASSFLFAQSPQGINYQAIARDVSGIPLASQTISVTFRIKEGSPSGTVKYRGSDNFSTNAFGLFTAIIGQSASDSGNFSNIKWGFNAFFLQVLINGNDMGTTKFMTVPYSFHAISADSLTPAGNRWNKTADSLYPSILSNRVGIGTSSPKAKLHIFDAADPLQIMVQNQGGNFTTGFRIKTATNEWFLGQEGPGANGFRISDVDASSVPFQIDPSGNVGIGNTSPTWKLDVNGGSNGIRVEGYGANGNGIKLVNTDVSTQEWTLQTLGTSGFFGPSKGFAISDITNSQNPFLVDANTPSGTLNLKSSGNVGIGATTPKSTLKVMGSMAGNYVNPTVSNYTCTSKDLFVIVSIGASTILLPPANSVDKGSELIIRNIANSNIGVSRQGTDVILLMNNINAVTGVPLNSPGGANPSVVRLVSDGVSNWIEW